MTAELLSLIIVIFALALLLRVCWVAGLAAALCIAAWAAWTPQASWWAATLWGMVR